MRKMKDSGIEWIGEIPESWEIVRVKHLFNIGRGRVIAQHELEEVGYPVYSSQTQNDGCLGYISTFDYDCSQLTWTTDGANAGTVFLREGKHNCTNVCGTLSPKDDANNLKYLKYALEYIAIFHKRADTNGYKIMNNEMSEIAIVVPSRNIQDAIADYLDKKCAEIDALIASKEKTNELLKERRQSIIYEAVTKGLNPDAPMKDSGIEWIGQIPEHWKTTRLRSKFSFGKGLPITKADLTESGIGVISYGQIHSKSNVGTTIKPELVRYVDSRYLDTNESSMVYNGDFIFADTSEDLSGCGNCVYVDVDYPLFAGYHTMILRPESDTSSKYYSYLFATDAWRSQIRAQATGVKLFSITQKMLRDTLLIEPTEEEKERIVAFLDEKCSLTDATISDNETTIQKLKEYRQSIIYEAVTGKIEI